MSSNNEYMRTYMVERRANRRKTLLGMAGAVCAVCGSEDSLEFNHLDRKTKSFELSGRGLDKAWKTILLEFEKCNLLCKTHHIEYTQKQYISDEIKPWNKDLHGEYLHGSPRLYHAGCRCDRCKKAKSIYRNKGCSNSEVVA